MLGSADIGWFKQQFADDVAAAVAGTPFDLDMITAIACQETGFIWASLRRTDMTRERILELCVGDTIDKRSVFPRGRAELEAAPSGAQMFTIARAALVDMAAHVAGYSAIAAKPNKFCHGFGIFQYDIQFFRSDPDHFLQRRYVRFDAALSKCLAELRRALVKLGWSGRHTLSDLEKAAVAIAYNRGFYEPERGLKQGHFDGKRYYGEYFLDYLRLAHSVALPGGPSPGFAPAAPGNALVAPPTTVGASGATYEVDTREGLLRVRSRPVIGKKTPTRNVIGQLPDGHRVLAIGAGSVDGFLLIETNLRGAHLRGFAAERYLKRVADAGLPPVTAPAATMPTSGVVAVSTPRRPGSVTRRAAPADAYSLNESGQPARKGATPAELCRSIAGIVDWLAVERPDHQRYQPKGGATFCNIYAHDYCTLADVYLPRVWWNASAIERLARGEIVTPRYGSTIDEQRANDLFRWLRDFGQRFGWRQTGSLTTLQTEVNQGAIGLIVARRKDEGRSGHIVAVVPETEVNRAKRDSAGVVIAPLQSQAGATNFRYGTSTANWWKDHRFAESGFWLHG